MLLKLENIVKTYDQTETSSPQNILNAITLQIEKGDAIAVTGPSGSGKSTLLNIMGGLDKPSSGNIYLDGQDLSKCSDKELAAIRNRDVGFIFQLHHLLPQCTVLENVLIPTIPAKRDNSSDTTKRAKRLLERVGLDHRLYHRPGQLSGGECQRTAFIRALINRPKLVLADEPTGSLDNIAAEKLGRLLIDLNREENVALVVVTHSIELARQLNTVYRLHEGVLEKINN